MDGGSGSESDGRPPALRPINVARPSDVSEGVDIRVFNDFEQQQQDAELPPEASSAWQSGGQPHFDSQPTMPVHHSSHGEFAPRKVISFAPSRFKPQQSGPEPRAFSGPQPKAFSGPQPKAFSRLREQGGAQSDSPRSPGGTRTPGAYDLFKTRSRKFSGPLEKLEKKSGPLGRQLTRIITRRRPAEEPAEEQEGGVDVEQPQAPCGKEQPQAPCGKEQQRQKDENGGSMHTALSAGRYFDALSGPELEDVKDTENLLLPADEKWPFLLRFPIGTFGMALGLGSQTMLWKALGQMPEMAFLHVPMWISLALWSLALLVLVVVFVIYFLKIQFYFEAVRREYHHPVRVNFFFAPWIAAMFLAIGVPPAIATTVHPAVWCCLMLPVFCLELKIYGQWLSGGQRRLSKVANPSTHLSVVGNFVGSTLAAMVGWKEPAIFFWAVGLAHYLVLFVTLYQRLPTNETLPNDLHPVFFLFVAAPSAASVAWMRIVGEFDYVSRLVFFIALFLYSSLIVRINFFRGFKFSVAWWAYTFPMTAAAIAAIQYCHVATSWITRTLALALSIISSTTVATLFVSTLLHIFWWRCLFPNDLAIAITAYKPKTAFFHKPSDNDDGCGLYSLHHSEPLYKSMLDAYHHFLEARDNHELSVVADPSKASESSDTSPGNAVHNNDHLHRSTTA